MSRDPHPIDDLKRHLGIDAAIAGHIQDIRDFHEHLLDQSELQPLIDDPATLERLKQGLRRHFQSMTGGDYGATLDALLRLTFFDMSLALESYHGAHPRERAAASRELEAANAETQYLARIYSAIVTPVELRGCPGAVVMHVNVTDRKEREPTLWRGANHDALTNVPNRVLLLDRLTQAISQSQRQPGGAAAHRLRPLHAGERPARPSRRRVHAGAGTARRPAGGHGIGRGWQ
ncbi:MAG: hypothetical protein Q8O34_09275 [Rhodocyclaceae bacterium]|nr:hypothetical protein [Rhodocyclaceae bacterium]